MGLKRTALGSDECEKDNAIWYLVFSFVICLFPYHKIGFLVSGCGLRQYNSFREPPPARRGPGLAGSHPIFFSMNLFLVGDLARTTKMFSRARQVCTTKKLTEPHITKDIWRFYYPWRARRNTILPTGTGSRPLSS